LSMHSSPEGKEILEALMIDSFTLPKEDWYDPIQHMHVALSKG